MPLKRPTDSSIPIWFLDSPTLLETVALSLWSNFLVSNSSRRTTFLALMERANLDSRNGEKYTANSFDIRLAIYHAEPCTHQNLWVRLRDISFISPRTLRSLKYVTFQRDFQIRCKIHNLRNSTTCRVRFEIYFIQKRQNTNFFCIYDIFSNNWSYFMVTLNSCRIYVSDLFKRDFRQIWK